MWFPFGEPVTRLRRQRVADPYNPASTVLGPWSSATSLALADAYVASASSTDTGDATRTQVVTSKSLYCQPDSDVQTGDRIVSGDAVYEVPALPEADTNPFTGWKPWREVPVEEVRG